MAAVHFALFFVFITLLRDSMSHVDAFQCGKVDRLAGYVINAEETENVWPWHVAVYNATNNYIAGGTIISESFVLTAAHVTFRKQHIALIPADLYVVMGIKDLSNPQNYTRYGNVSKIIRYPNYDTERMVNDLALLRLTEKIQFSMHISPICLWPVGGPDLEKLALEQRGTVVGWGFTENSTISQVLREASMSIIDFQSCAENTKSFQPLLAKGRNYCAGNRGETTVCRGDSGGGMYFLIDYTWYIRGIVNQGTPTQDTRYPCDPKKEVIFMDVTFYQKWVERYALPKKHNRMGLHECGLGDYMESSQRLDKVLAPVSNPWIVHLHYLFWDRFYVSDCHGLLIHVEFVLTLARCLVDRPNRKLINVILGEDLIGSDPYDESQSYLQVLGISDVFIHEKFQNEGYGYDVGLVRLISKADFSRDNIKPICLPSSLEPVPYYILTAWYRRDDHPKQLKNSLMREIRFSACSAMYRRTGVETKQEDCLICFQHCKLSDKILANGTHSCELISEEGCSVPISGGPVYYTAHDGFNTYTYLVGLRSFGSAKCEDKFNDMYSDMVTLGPWIKRIVEENALFIDNV
ncbi:serine protease 30-like [Toxorhynchites rutilus septentrionalis]|uniref:serine protease 30-like n=1 Tax=Toxorhynchites rutilus septentrionalis TaxID=329112 RepID=UPI0024785A66|nr:serine protease 30-like [Toxorhynchites rutilus septentrionalis]